MIKIESDKANGYLEVTIDGRVSKEDYVAMVAEVDAMLETHERLDLVEVVRAFGPFPPEVWWKDMIFHLTHRHWLDHVAVVSELGWVGPVTRFFAPLYPAAVRYFPLAQLDEAREWARSSKMTEAAAG